MPRTAVRATVVDLGYGHVRSSTGRTADVTELLDAVDASSVLVDGVRRHCHQAWQQVWRELGIPEHAPDPGAGAGELPILVGYPSTWGRVRSAAVARSVDALGGAALALPRAVLIARSHTDGTVQRCAVVETSHRPRLPDDPTRPRRSRWDVTRHRRGMHGWEIEAVDVVEPTAADVAERIGAIVDDSVDMVLVDGEDGNEVTEAIDLVTEHALAGRVIAVDRDLVVRLGWRTGRPESAEERQLLVVPPDDDPARPPRATARWIGLAAAGAVLVALGAGVVGFMQRGHVQTEAVRTATVDRTSIEVPAAWRQSSLGRPPRDSSGETIHRTVFADRDDGRRILLVQTSVRDDATLRTVATSLNNRIRQRGDDVVTEFSPATRFMGRDVISYREAPGSGSAIRWYVVVADGLQVSVGCQPGGTGESVDAQCQRAVASVRTR